MTHTLTQDTLEAQVLKMEEQLESAHSRIDELYRLLDALRRRDDEAEEQFLTDRVGDGCISSHGRAAMSSVAEATERWEPAGDDRPRFAPQALALEPVHSNGAISRLEKALRAAITPSVSKSAYREFVREFAAEPFGSHGGADGYLMVADVGDGRVAIVPSYEFLSNFSTIFHAARSMPADMRNAFDFESDESRAPKLLAAAVGREDGGRLIVLRKGRLGGLTA